MRKIARRILTDEANRPVAVQIEYQDWLEIERMLGQNGEAPRVSTDLGHWRGALRLTEDALDYQRRIRGEWS